MCFTEQMLDNDYKNKKCTTHQYPFWYPWAEHVFPDCAVKGRTSFFQFHCARRNLKVTSEMWEHEVKVGVRGDEERANSLMFYKLHLTLQTFVWWICVLWFSSWPFPSLQFTNFDVLLYCEEEKCANDFTAGFLISLAALLQSCWDIQLRPCA